MSHVVDTLSHFELFGDSRAGRRAYSRIKTSTHCHQIVLLYRDLHVFPLQSVANGSVSVSVSFSISSIQWGPMLTA